MAQSDRSLQQIRQETEQTRSELINTVQQLRNTVVDTSRDIRERVRPAAIKSEMTNYVRSRSEQWLDELKNAARENPLQAVAIGGGLAYPLFRLVRAIPVPLLMIGAGLYLAGSKGGNAEHVSSIADDLSEGVRQQTEAMGDQLSEAKARVGARGAELKDRVTQQAGNVAEAVKGFADQAAIAGQRYAEAAKGATEGAVQSVKGAASDLKGRATKSFGETLEQNPLVIAGIGLLIGGVIAGALPRTEMEGDLLRDTAEAIKQRARSAASRGLDAAKDAADEAARRAHQQAQEEGLHPDGMRESIRDVGERVRHVAETAVTTAFEPPEENNQSNDQGASSHG